MWLNSFHGVPGVELELRGRHFAERRTVDAQGRVRGEVRGERREAVHGRRRFTEKTRQFWQKAIHPVSDPGCTCGMYAGINMQHLIDINYIMTAHLIPYSFQGPNAS